MQTRITQVVFDGGTARGRESVVTRAEFDALMGAYMINGVEVDTQWLYGHKTDGGQLITLRDARGRVVYLWFVEMDTTTEESAQ